MRRSSLAIRVVMLLISIVASAVLAQAQYRGSLRGTVSDPQGAVVAGATVTLVNTDTSNTMVSTLRWERHLPLQCVTSGALSPYCGSERVQTEGA
jgi:hypothetical protein